MKISQIIKTVIAGTLISTSTITYSLYHSEKAKAEVDHYYRDGFQYPTYVTALNKAKKSVIRTLVSRITQLLNKVN